MTQRLISIAAHNWPAIDGFLASQGVDPFDWSPDRFLNMVHWWATKDGDPQSVDIWLSKIWMPPKGEAPAPGSPWSPEAETAAFGALMAEVGLK